MGRFLFPQWIDRARPLAGVLLAVAPLYLLGVLYYGGSPRTTDVGYQPKQPVPFSHALHAGELGLDCRYCHTTVEVAAHAAIPSTSICLNCHAQIATQSEKLLAIRQSYANATRTPDGLLRGQPVRWVRVHDLPDYAYFHHGAHVSRGVGCVSCHGRVDRMDEVAQVETLSMGWCLDCHRNPEPHLRPQQLIADLGWVPGEDQLALGRRLREENKINPSTDCSTCHR